MKANTNADEKIERCTEYREAYANCQAYKRDNEADICGWEADYQRLKSQYGCGSSDSPGPGTDFAGNEGLEQRVCGVLHSAYAEATGDGGVYADDPCRAGNYSRQMAVQALNEGEEGFGLIQCPGTSDPINFQDSSCPLDTSVPTSGTSSSVASDESIVGGE